MAAERGKDKPTKRKSVSIRKESTTVSRVRRLDASFLELATKAFSAWNDPKAEKAFHDL